MAKKNSETKKIALVLHFAHLNYLILNESVILLDITDDLIKIIDQVTNISIIFVLEQHSLLNITLRVIFFHTTIIILLKDIKNLLKKLFLYYTVKISAYFEC